MASAYEELQQKIALRKQELSAECKKLFSSQKVFVLEIGCGHGHFLTSFARENPDKFCVGIDIIIKRVERGRMKKEREALKNLHFIKAEAMEFLEAIPSGVLASDVFLLFPDPWPKRRHHKNRLLQSGFLKLLAQKCAAGASFHFRTDHEGYFESGKQCFEEHSDWTICVDGVWPHEEETVFQKLNPIYQSLIARKN